MAIELRPSRYWAAKPHTSEAFECYCCGPVPAGRSFELTSSVDPAPIRLCATCRQNLWREITNDMLDR